MTAINFDTGFDIHTGWAVPAGVTSVWLEVWGAYGGQQTWWYNGGYAEADYACTPGEVLSINVMQNVGEYNVNTSIFADTIWLVTAGSGWDDTIMDGGPGSGDYNAAYTTGGSATGNSNPGFARARITYTAGGGGPIEFVGWGVPL